MSNPAKVDVDESHKGADTMPTGVSQTRVISTWTAMPTILYQNIQTLLDQQGCVEDDQAEAERKNVITRADFEEISNGALQVFSVSMNQLTIALNSNRR